MAGDSFRLRRLKRLASVAQQRNRSASLWLARPAALLQLTGDLGSYLTGGTDHRLPAVAKRAYVFHIDEIAVSRVVSIPLLVGMSRTSRPTVSLRRPAAAVRNLAAVVSSR